MHECVCAYVDAILVPCNSFFFFFFFCPKIKLAACARIYKRNKEMLAPPRSSHTRKSYNAIHYRLFVFASPNGPVNRKPSTETVRWTCVPLKSPKSKPAELEGDSGMFIARLNSVRTLTLVHTHMTRVPRGSPSIERSRTSREIFSKFHCKKFHHLPTDFT